jgi:AcrR family transcriptional regulator
MGRAGQTPRGVATRARIVEVATALFVKDGYQSTTMAAIAKAAGVSPQAVYLAFGSKAAILKVANDVAVVGDHDEVPLIERPWADDLRARVDARGALDLALEVVTSITERAAPIYEVTRSAAAEPEVAKLLDQWMRQRLAGWHEIAAILRTKDGFRRRLTAARAGDILYGLVSPDLLRELVVGCGWSGEQWREFVRTSARHHLLEPGTT